MLHFKDEILALRNNVDERKRLIFEKCTKSKIKLEEALKITASNFLPIFRRVSLYEPTYEHAKSQPATYFEFPEINKEIRDVNTPPVS